MEKLTITEALSEINLIKKKVAKKEPIVLGNLTRPKHLADTFKEQGGTQAFLESEMQAIQDLRDRLVRIRGSIAKANMESSITIGDETKTIHDWLTWKREVSQDQIKFLNNVHNNTKQTMDQMARQPQVYKDDAGNTHLVEFVSNIDYVKVLKKTEALGDIFEKLDGQLSLKNALIVVEF